MREEGLGWAGQGFGARSDERPLPQVVTAIFGLLKDEESEEDTVREAMREREREGGSERDRGRE